MFCVGEVDFGYVLLFVVFNYDDVVCFKVGEGVFEVYLEVFVVVNKFVVEEGGEEEDLVMEFFVGYILDGWVIFLFDFCVECCCD